MTTFSLVGVDAAALQRRLWQEHRIKTRLVGGFNALRISTAYYNDQADVDRLLGALDEGS